ncbi:hypothetical protein [Psychromonas sp. KJ10-2]|uniref:hypothetical protein n=1 Tax=Psychromonas sp. KJ10-2 TaxID=3391822 RepID=UPI0039B66214
MGLDCLKDADETGGGVSNIDGVFPDGFSLLMWSCDWTFSETLNEVAIFLGIEDWKAKERVTPKIINKPAKVKRTDEKTLLNRRLKLRKLWAESYGINHPESKVAKKYFTNEVYFYQLRWL